MNGMQEKERVVTLIFAYLIASILVCGCSMHNKEYYHCEDTATSSGKPLIIDLANNLEYQPLLTGKPQTCGMRSGRVYLKPSEDCGQHSTKAHEEMLVFLSGKGTALIGDQDQQPAEYEVGQGKVSYIPPYTIHNMKNTGTEPLVYIYCVVPVRTNHEDHNDHEEHHH